MANSYSGAVFDFDTFMPTPAHKTAPEYEPHIVEKEKKSDTELRAEARFSMVSAIKIAVTALVLFSLFAFVLFSRFSLTKLTHEAEKYKSQLDIAHSESVRLNMELEELVSDETIEDYAVNVLGMRKLKRYQIHYFQNKAQDKAEVLTNN